MTAHPLRSRNWFGRNDLDGFVHRSWLEADGFSDAVFDGRPVVGIANSWSELTNCNAHLRQVAEAVKRGVWSAGGFPLEFPAISLGEVLMKLARRRAAWKPRPAHVSRGYGKLFLDHVLQANEGCDFDYLRGRTPVRHEDTAGPSHS